MACDLSRTATTGLRVQCCGDAHLSNFGLFAAPDAVLSSISTTSMRRCRRRLSGTSSASWRASSSPPAQRPPSQGAADGGARCRRGLSDHDGQGGEDALPGCLVHAVRRGQAARGSRTEIGKGRDQVLSEALAKAQTRTSLGSLSKYAQPVDGGYRIKQQPPVIVRPPETMHDDFEQIIRQGSPTMRAR